MTKRQLSSIETSMADSNMSSSSQQQQEGWRRRRSASVPAGKFVALVLALAVIASLSPPAAFGLTPAKPPSNPRKSKNLSSSVSSNLSVGTAVNRNRPRKQHPRGGNPNRPQNRQRPSQNQVSQASIFVKNLHYQASKADIVQACKQAYGNVKSVWIPRDNSKKGYAKVEFEDRQVAQTALQNGRLDVLGRHAYLVPDTRPQDPQGDAFRYLAAFSKGDFDVHAVASTTQDILHRVRTAGPPRSEKERGILAAALARVGARDDLVKILRWKNHKNLQHNRGGASTSVYNSALSAMKVTSHQDCQLAQELVAMAEAGPGVNARTYATAIASIKRGAAHAVDDWSKAATAFWKTALDKGLANHVVYNELIACLAKKGSWKLATSVLDRMFEDDAVEPTEVSLNAAIASCAVAGQMEAAIQIYEESFQRAKLTPSIVTTNSLVSTAHKWIKKRRLSFAKEHHAQTGGAAAVLDPSDAQKAMDFVKRVLRDATQRGDELDGVSMNTLVSAYGAAGDVSSAMGLFREACLQHKATTVTANAALSALALAGKVTEAAALVRQLDGHRWEIPSDRTSWNTAISACGVTGDWETALELLEEMPQGPDAHSFASALSAVAGDEHSNGSTPPVTSESVWNLLARADAAQAATTFVLNSALAALDRLGDFDSVQRLFEQGFAQRGLAPDVISYNTAIHSLGRNDPVVACQLFARLQQQQQQEETEESDSGAPSIARVTPDEQSYCAVLSALAKSGGHEEALDILKSCPDELQQSLSMHNEALRACHGAANPEAALQLLEDMKSQGPQPNLVSTTIVMNTCAKAGREYEAGFQLFEEAESPDLIAFNSAIALAEKAGDPDLSISFLTRLVRAESVEPDAVSFCSAIASCETGANGPRCRTALRLLRESLKAVGPNAGCYIATVQTLAAAGDLEHALELLTHDCINDFDQQSQYVLYRTVQVACASCGDAIAADRLGKEMQERNLKALAPLARARVGGSLLKFDNQIDANDNGDEEINHHFDTSVHGEVTQNHKTVISMADIANTVQEIVQKTDHTFVTSALPIEFQAHSSQKGQEISLANHAEKKALAQLLLDEKQNSDPDHPSFATLSVEINFKMCADCHAFFKGASSYLGRRLTVREPTMLHVFEDGECSCNNSWRWEERHASGNTAAVTATPGAASKHRFGRLPPLLKP